MTFKGNIYSIHDESGRIAQSNQVFDDANGAYGKILAEREMTFVQHHGPTHANPLKHFVSNGSVVNRPRFRISIDRTRIKAGGTDEAIITGVPKGVTISISIRLNGASVPVHAAQFDGPSFGFPAPVPGIYAITISKHPYRDWQATIEATE